MQERHTDIVGRKGGHLSACYARATEGTVAAYFRCRQIANALDYIYIFCSCTQATALETLSQN